MEAVVLLGWMRQQVAVGFLRDNCVFDEALSSMAAEALWQRYRRNVERLPPCQPFPVPNFALTDEEQRATDAFLNDHAKHGSPITSVLKTDPHQLAVCQLSVTLDRCARYVNTCQTRAQWLAEWLNPLPTPMHGRIRYATNAVNVEVPHGEFALLFHPEEGFRVVEGPRHLTVAQLAAETVLRAGYHRVYGYLISPVAVHDRTIVAPVMTDGRNLPRRALAGADGCEDLCERRPPVFADFFNDALRLRVTTRPKRFELQIRARMAAVAASSESEAGCDFAEARH